MASFNKIILMGNLTRDPEVRYTPKGTAVGELGLAVNRRVSDGNGNWTDEVTFVDITVWGTNAENAQKYLTKGRGILVEGRLQVDTWDDKEPQKKRTKLKVIAELLQFLSDGKGSDRATTSNASPDTDPASAHSSGSTPSAGSYRPPANEIPDPNQGLEEDIPF